MLLDRHDPDDSSLVAWPDLPPEPLARLKSLPFWDIAVSTEAAAAIRTQALAEASDDPLITEAVALNAFEERRHKELLPRRAMAAQRPPAQCRASCRAASGRRRRPPERRATGA
jgi:hypothetical protein